MKYIVLVLLAAGQAQAQYFSELRLGVEDGYGKVVQHATNGTLEGTFKGFNYGLRAGYNKDQLSYFIEINPQQEVEIEPKNELATVNSTYLGVRYNFGNGLYAGGLLGYTKYELEQGPNGVTFATNPVTSGITYGILFGYAYDINDRFYIGTDAMYAFGSYDDAGPSNTPVRNLEIENQYQLNLLLGLNF